jgi:hypothetical protein
VPLDDPANDIGFGLFPVTCIVKSDGCGHVKPCGHVTSFPTKRVPVCGLGDGVTVVVPSGQVTATAQADCDWF